MSTLFYVGIILIIGLIFGRIVSYLKLPEVTGYLIGGVIIGPSIIGIIPHYTASQLSIISEAALGFIAYSIGSQLNFKHLKKVGTGIILITVCESLGAVLLVTVTTMMIFHKGLPFSIVLGAIAAATAPAATLMVIRQYKAEGPLVDTLLPTVAIDDAVGIITFGIAITVAKVLVDASASVSVASMILNPLIEIFLAIIVGTGIGIILSYVANRATGQDRLLSLTIGVILASIGIAVKLEVSPLLLCMSIGAAVSNIVPNSKRVIGTIDKFTPPVFIAFFTLAGAELNLGILGQVGLVGIGYILVRAIGKSLGAGIGARLAKAPKTVQKYLGLTLIPQAGVAIGLAMIAEAVIPNGEEIRAIILGATVVYELVGPLLTKIAIFKAGEAMDQKNIGSVKSSI